MTTSGVWAAVGELLALAGEGLGVKSLADGRYVYANAALGRLLSTELSRIVGRTDADLFDAGQLAVLRAADGAAAARGEVLETDHLFERVEGRREFRVRRRLVEVDGHPVIVSVWSDPVPRRQELDQLQTALRQIEEQQRAHEQLRREWSEQGLRDAASGLHSRAHFEEHLRRETDLSQREHREYAIVFVALDGTEGSDADGRGQVLESLGRLLRSGTRVMDASCRWDEQRFAVLLSGVGLATAHSRMESLRRQCATQIVVHGGQQLRFTVSMGIASYPHTADGGEGLLAAGEQALHEARRRGGNQVALASIRLDRP